MEPNRFRFRQAWKTVRISKARYDDRTKGLFPHTINFTDGAIISFTVIPGSSERVPGHGAPGTAARITMNNLVRKGQVRYGYRILWYRILRRVSVVVSNTRSFCSYVYVIMRTTTLCVLTSTRSTSLITHFCQKRWVGEILLAFALL